MERTRWSKQAQKQTKVDKEVSISKDSTLTSTKPKQPPSPMPLQLQSESVSVSGESTVGVESKTLSTAVSVGQDSKKEVTYPPQSEAIIGDNTMPVENSDEDIVKAVEAAFDGEAEPHPRTPGSESVNVQEVEKAVRSLKIEETEVENVTITVLDRDQSNVCLTSIFVDALQRC